MPTADLPFDSLFDDLALQEFAKDLAQLRNADNEQLEPAAWTRLAACVDTPYNAFRDLHYWDTLVVDRKHVFTHYLWPLIRGRKNYGATREDVLLAIHQAAQYMRANDERLNETLTHATFLGPPPTRP